jgi:transposase
MAQRTLVPYAGEVLLDEIAVPPGCDRLIMRLRPARKESICPACGRSSRRVHSRYYRRVNDLPWQGIPVRIELRARRFFCDNDECGQWIFTERLRETAPWYARRTRRLSRTLERITLTAGGAAGARLAQQLGILASGVTLLRQLRHQPPSEGGGAPRVVGIDDWAWRKGRRYGTILCDLERGKAIDLLPERSAENTERWLRAHPGVEVISRDRVSLYAEAATKAAPQAVQVADRWHLLHNLSEALVDALRPHHRLLSEVAHVVTASEKPSPVAVAQPSAVAPPLSRVERVRQQNRERRLARYEAVMKLARQGLSQREITRPCRLNRTTVRRWVSAGSFPERKPSRHRSTIDRHREYLETRWQQGCRNAAQLWRELRARGFAGRPHNLRRPRTAPKRHSLHSRRHRYRRNHPAWPVPIRSLPGLTI